MEKPVGQFRGCGRGVFALADWTIPLRRPQQLISAAQTDEEAGSRREGQKLMMKYRYTANTDSPIGQELTVKQKDTVYFLSQHDEHWMNVRSESGEEGYVPASYTVVVEEKVSSLPWLDQKKQEDKQVQESAQWKPYKSAYAPKEPATGGPATDEENYMCNICVKKFNGPIPYQVHLNSKNHKEEVEASMDQ